MEFFAEVLRVAGDGGTVWRYEGEVLVLDLLDEADVARYRAAVEALRAAGDDGEERGFIGGFCGRLRAFFDAVFGEGVGERLMGGEANLRRALACYEDFLRFGAAQAEAAQALFARAVKAYAPGRVKRARGETRG